jgi:hypothetical protein
MHGGGRESGGLSVPVPDAGARHSTADWQVEMLAGVVSTQRSHPWTGARASSHLHIGEGQIKEEVQSFAVVLFGSFPTQPTQLSTDHSMHRRCMLACTHWQWKRGMDQNYTTAKKRGILPFYCSMPSHIFYRSSLEGKKFLLQRFYENLVAIEKEKNVN